MRGRRGARAKACDSNAAIVGSIPTRGNELLFIIWYQVEFRHSTRNTSQVQWKVGN